MKKLFALLALLLLLFTATAYGFFDFGFSRMKTQAVSTGDAVLWDDSGDKILWDDSGDAILWD